MKSKGISLKKKKNSTSVTEQHYFLVLSMTCLKYLAAVCILAGTSATPTEPPPPTTTLTEDSTDTPMPASSSNSTKENGTNRILNYGVVAGSSFGVFEDDLHAPIHPYPPPHPPLRPPFLPAPGHILPGRPPFPPHNSILPSTGSCKYYCPGLWQNQLYCCDG